MKGPHTQRESRHCSTRNTALFLPAQMDSFGGNCALQSSGNRPAAFVSALKLWYSLFHSEQVADFPKGWLSLQSRFQAVPESAHS